MVIGRLGFLFEPAMFYRHMVSCDLPEIAIILEPCVEYGDRIASVFVFCILLQFVSVVHAIRFQLSVRVDLLAG